VKLNEGISGISMEGRAYNLWGSDVATNQSLNPLQGWSLVIAANDDNILQNTLFASPSIGPECQIIIKRGFPCAGKAYNAGLAESRHELVVFAHQDVYLPATWIDALRESLADLERTNPGWGVLGPFGVACTNPAQLTGFCYSTGLGRILGGPFSSPVPARTLDELVLVVRRSSGLSFDEQIPGFHLYGTDICLAAAARGMNSYIVPSFCIHNANGIVQLPSEFWRAYFYLRRKWRSALPVTTCCTTITKWCFPVVRRVAAEFKGRNRVRRLETRTQDVVALYENLCRTNPEICAAPVQN
jgi:hypothetical protein